jgi:CBS domain-containing membrane protein
MAQPWPMFGGHLLASFIGVLCAQTIAQPALATATAVGLAIFCMYWLRCLHPPSAATAMIAVLGGPQVHALGWSFCYEVVAINAGILLLLAFIFNNLVPGRRYPLRHSHHPHHVQFAQQTHPAALHLDEADFEAALARMDGVIDVTSEDLVDIYEFAVENAEARRKPA